MDSILAGVRRWAWIRPKRGQPSVDFRHWNPNPEARLTLQTTQEVAMNRLFLIASVSAVVGLAGCHKTGENAGKDVENPGQSAPVNTVQDMAAGPVGVTSAATIGANTSEGFVTGAAMGDMYEIEAGKIALQRSKTPAIRTLAQMLIDHHTAMTADLKSALATAKVAAPLPTALDERRKGMLDNLRAAGDTDFDLAFLHQQLAAHLEALTLHKGYGTMGDNAALKAVADKAAPRVQQHIDEIRKIGGAKLDAAT
jgi:putative membrane protein